MRIHTGKIGVLDRERQFINFVLSTTEWGNIGSGFTNAMAYKGG